MTQQYGKIKIEKFKELMWKKAKVFTINANDL